MGDGMGDGSATGSDSTGDSAWAEQNFCGGLGGTECSSPVRDKRIADPF
jgi:hypothetical protein